MMDTKRLNKETRNMLINSRLGISIKMDKDFIEFLYRLDTSKKEGEVKFKGKKISWQKMVREPKRACIETHLYYPVKLLSDNIVHLGLSKVENKLQILLTICDEDKPKRESYYFTLEHSSILNYFKLVQGEKANMKTKKLTYRVIDKDQSINQKTVSVKVNESSNTYNEFEEKIRSRYDLDLEFNHAGKVVIVKQK